jgi:hypothetical protein
VREAIRQREQASLLAHVEASLEGRLRARLDAEMIRRQEELMSEAMEALPQRMEEAMRRSAMEAERLVERLRRDAEEEKRQQRLERVVRRWRHRHASLAFVAWRTALRETKMRVVAAWRAQGLTRAWRQWRGASHEHLALRRALLRMRGLPAARAFSTWEKCTRMRRQARAARLRQEAFITQLRDAGPRWFEEMSAEDEDDLSPSALGLLDARYMRKTGSLQNEITKLHQRFFVYVSELTEHCAYLKALITHVMHRENVNVTSLWHERGLPSPRVLRPALDSREQLRDLATLPPRSPASPSHHGHADVPAARGLRASRSSGAAFGPGASALPPVGSPGLSRPGTQSQSTRPGTTRGTNLKFVELFS